MAGVLRSEKESRGLAFLLLSLSKKKKKKSVLRTESAKWHNKKKQMLYIKSA